MAKRDFIDRLFKAIDNNVTDADVRIAIKKELVRASYIFHKVVDDIADKTALKLYNQKQYEQFKRQHKQQQEE